MGAEFKGLWSPAAQDDLIDIWGYFAKLASPEIADALLYELETTATLIAENPDAWRERNDLMRGIHAVPVHPYTIFYRIIDREPEIVRVLHERRDIVQILSSTR